MEKPIIKEIPRKLEPVDHDTFIDGLGSIALSDEVEKPQNEPNNPT